MAEHSPELVMPEALRLGAYKPLKRMLDWSEAPPALGLEAARGE